MPTPTAQALRVAECGECQQLFAVYATEGAVACPACSASVEIAALEVAEIGVATPIEARIEEPTQFPAEPVAEPIDETPEPEQATVSVPAAETLPEPEPAAEERPPTVAEWLLRGGDPNISASGSPGNELPNTKPAAKPSLSDSLGWTPGSFALEGTAPAAEPAPTTEPESVVERAREPIAQAVPPDSDAFRFDFEKTPLAEQPIATPETHDEEARLDLTSAPEADLADAAAQPQGLEWSATPEPSRRRWSGVLSAAAGILFVAAPAAWMAWTWPDESELAAATNRQQRDLMAAADPAAELADFQASIPSGGDVVQADPSESVSSLPFGSETAPAAPPMVVSGSEEPIIDEQTLPASYNAPAAAAAAPMPDLTSPTEDPFRATLPAETAKPDDRYAVSAAGGRYGAVQPNKEPDTFTLPEDGFEPIASESEAQPEPAATPPRESLGEVGLINVPHYAIDELRVAVSGGEPAGKAFATGTLADPEQASEMGKNYARLCYLAQVLTLLDPVASGPDVMTTQLEATDVFNRLFREAGPREESRQIAGPWMAWNGRPHGGVFFAGTPVDIRKVGEATEYLFEFGEQRIPVVMTEKLDVRRFVNAAAREIGVMGIVVDNPRERIAGYEGDAERVVWVRKTLALREPVEL